MKFINNIIFIFFSAEDSGRVLISSLPSFAKDQSGQFSLEPLYLLLKKGGGVRSIAVGLTLRRLIGKCLSSSL